MHEEDLEMEEHKEALASIIEADPHPRGGALSMVFFGIVTAKLDPVVLNLGNGIERLDLLGRDGFVDYLAGALEMGTTQAVQRFGIDPVSFPGRLAVFLHGDGPRFIPALLVGDRLITGGNREHDFCATDKPPARNGIRRSSRRPERGRMKCPRPRARIDRWPPFARDGGPQPVDRESRPCAPAYAGLAFIAADDAVSRAARSSTIRNKWLARISISPASTASSITTVRWLLGFL
jgi:hypothetical protein